MQLQTSQNIRRILLDYLAGACFVDLSTIDDETSFMEMGVLDSVGFLEMVAFLEKTFQTKIADDELVPQNMDSIARLIRFVERKRVEGAPSP